MNQDQRIKKAIELANSAAEADREQRYQEALDLYSLSLDNWVHIHKFETNPQIKERLKTKISEYLERAEQIKVYLKKQADEPKPVPAGGGESKEDKEASEMKRKMADTIVSDKPNVKWEDVAGLDAAKEALQEAVILPTRFPQLFEGKRTPWKGILLYGPPGTGKSYLAKATATEADATFFSLSAADLISKWMGESEKMVRTLFEQAREQKPSIIFIDEVDSIASSRGEGEQESSRRIKTEFMAQMDGVGKDVTGVLVLGATNCPWDLDAAIRRRFERRIYIPLPDPHARKAMLQLSIGSTPTSLSEEQKDNIAQETDGFSGADISILVRQAIMEPVRKCKNATHFKVKPTMVDGTELNMLTPCSPGDPDPSKVETSLMKIDPKLLLPPPATDSDFGEALSHSKPSVSPEDLTAFADWTDKFGIEG
jgi:vacuolar protein-sorting-associated protein 4